MDSGVVIPSCVYPPSGLAEFVLSRRWHEEPEPGDVVFYSFSTARDEPFGMPHVGIVVNTDGWKKEKRFTAVEGDRGGQVLVALRHRHEVIGFGRPDFKFRPGKTSNLQTGNVFVDPDRVRIGHHGSDVMNVQLALEQVADLREYTPGTFDDATRVAYARWQRIIGHVGALADGVPNARTLAQLGHRTGVFSVTSEKF